jgi:hypothetical protein
MERRKHKDDAHVCHQPLPELVPEEQDINAHDNRYQSKHVKRDDGVSSHRFTLRCWRYSRGGRRRAVPGGQAPRCA